VDAGEGGQQRRVDVQNRIRVGRQQRRPDAAHVSGQHHQVHLALAQDLQVPPLGLEELLRAVAPYGHVLGGDVMFPCALEGPRVGLVADDDHHAGVNAPRLAVVNDRLQVRASA